jgi:hypothetical protein
VITHKPGDLGRCLPVREVSDAVEYDTRVEVEVIVEAFGGCGLVAKIGPSLDYERGNAQMLDHSKLAA